MGTSSNWRWPASTRSVILLCLLWSAWLSLEYWAFGPHSYVFSHDEGDANLPALISTALHDSNVGQWAPGWLCGADRYANSMALPAYALVFRVLPGWAAYGFIMWLQRFVAACFMFLFCRDGLDLDPAPSLFCALAYSLYLQPWMNGSDGYRLYDGLVVPGIPLFLWTLDRVITRAPRFAWLVALLLGAFAGFVNSYATSMFVVPLLVIWIVVFSGANRRAAWTAAACFVLAWLVVSSPLAIAGLRNAAISNRVTWGLDNPLTVELRSQMLPGLLRYNLLFILLAAAGLGIAGFRSARLNFLLIAALLATLPMIAHRQIAEFSGRFIPFLKGFQADRFYLLVPFLLCAAAAIGLNLLLRELHRSPALPALVMASVLAVVVAESLWVKTVSLRQMVAGYTYDQLYRDPVLEGLRQATRGDVPFRVVTVISDINTHPSPAWAYGFDTADGYINLYPNAYKRFWAEVASPFLDRDPVRRRYFADWGGRVYLWSAESDTPPLQGDTLYRLNLLSLANVRFIFSRVPLRDDRLILRTWRDGSPLEAFRRLTFLRRAWQTVLGRAPYPALYVYENPQVLRRFFLAQESGRSAGALPAMDAQALRSDAVALPANPDSSPACEQGEVTVATHTPDHLDLQVNSRAPCALVITTNLGAGWTAKVDEKAATLFPVDEAFAGIALARGTHRVELTYNDFYWPRRR